ncbi:hypothetical protein D3C72_1227830 [compost metagenome]
MFSAACGAAGAGDSSCSNRPLSRSISEPIRSISSRSLASRCAARRASSCAAPFNPASGLRSSCARPFSAALSALGRAWVGSSPGNSSTGCASSSQPPSSRRLIQPSAKRAASPGKASASRFRRRLSRSSRARKWASASPCTSSAANGWPSRRRPLTPSQRAKAGLQPAMRPSGPDQASGVPRASREGGGAGSDIAPM